MLINAKKKVNEWKQIISNDNIWYQMVANNKNVIKY